MDRDVCPNGCDLQGEPIPQEYIDAGHYGKGVTHYSRIIGVEHPEKYDGVWFWLCPDCGVRWGGASSLAPKSNPYDLIVSYGGLPAYPLQDKAISELRELGYTSIELEDLIDMMEDEDAWIEMSVEKEMK